VAVYDRLSALDRIFLDVEGPNTHMHVAGVFVFEGGALRRPEGGIDIDRLRRYVASRLHLIPRYRQRIARIPIENHPVWVDDERFNVEYHVRHTSLPHPGDEPQLKRLCGRIISQQLDRGKPLWEMWIVEGLEHDRVALVSKVHHCMVDGISGVDLLQVLLSPTPEKEFDPPAKWYPRPAPSGGRLLRDAVGRWIQLPLGAARAARRGLREPALALERARDGATALAATARSALALGQATDTPINQPIGPHRRFDWVGFDIDEVRRVKRVLGGTVNDVVLATVAGAVGRFLAQRGVPQHQLARMDFRAFCPVSVRTAAESGTLGNRVSALIARLPVAERDPRLRLARVVEVMGDLKRSRHALSGELLSSVSEWSAPTLFSAAARLANGYRAANVVVTNVPGPRVPLYLLGARMTETYPIVPLTARQCLGIALFSYGGGLYWGFNADWDSIPDLHDFVVATDASFRELCDAADAAPQEPFA
jgi:WS/DGAT/MGAT family acyltransferase